MALTFKRAPGLRTVQVSALDAGQLVAATLYHETATPLLKQGEQLTAGHLRALAAAGIREVYECKTEDDLLALAAATHKTQYPLSAVSVGCPVAYNIYDGGNRFLLRKGGIMTSAQQQRMRDAKIDEVFINEEQQIQILRRYDLELTKCRAETIEKKFADDADLRVAGGESSLPNLFAKRPLTARMPATLRGMVQRYEGYIHGVDGFLNSLKRGKAVASGDVNRVVTGVLDGIVSDVDLAANFANTKDGGSFQCHSANVATLCVGVGLALGYKEPELKELCMAAMLHEVGMLGVPKEILEKRTALSPPERQRITDHPIHALNYLERVQGVPYRGLMAVYQEHECPDRSGYPNRRPGNLIHDFARIIALCDAYEAMTAPRPFRKPYLPYKALEQLVFATAKSRYAQSALRGLLQLIGLFPVGSWIKLSNNCAARVIGNNYERYDRPVVAVLYDGKNQRLAQAEILDLRHKPELQIADIVDGAQYQASSTLGF